jgi:hypothetical protein
VSIRKAIRSPAGPTEADPALRTLRYRSMPKSMTGARPPGRKAFRSSGVDPGDDLAGPSYRGLIRMDIYST